MDLGKLRRHQQRHAPPALTPSVASPAAPAVQRLLAGRADPRLQRVLPAAVAAAAKALETGRRGASRPPAACTPGSRRWGCPAGGPPEWGGTARKERKEGDCLRCQQGIPEQPVHNSVEGCSPSWPARAAPAGPVCGSMGARCGCRLSSASAPGRHTSAQPSRQARGTHPPALKGNHPPALLAARRTSVHSMGSRPAAWIWRSTPSALRSMRAASVGGRPCQAVPTLVATKLNTSKPRRACQNSEAGSLRASPSPSRWRRTAALQMSANARSGSARAAASCSSDCSKPAVPSTPSQKLEHGCCGSSSPASGQRQASASWR